MIKILIISHFLINLYCFQIKLSEKHKDYCFSKKAKIDYDLELQFIASGSSQDNVDMTVYQEDSVIKVERGKSEFVFILQHIEKVKFCFKKTNNAQTELLVEEFDLMNDHIAIKGDVDEVIFTNLQNNIDLLNKLKGSTKQIKFREETHKDLLDEMINKTKQLTVLKVLIIIAVSALQFYMFTNFFKNSKIFV